MCQWLCSCIAFLELEGPSSETPDLLSHKGECVICILSSRHIENVCKGIGKGMGMGVVMGMYKFGGDKLDGKVRLYIRIRCGQNTAVDLLRAKFPLIDDNRLHNRSSGLQIVDLGCLDILPQSTIHNPPSTVHSALFHQGYCLPVTYLIPTSSPEQSQRTNHHVYQTSPFSHTLNS